MFIGRENRYITSTEVLRGIDDETIGCVLALHSITYSVAPSLAIKSIDRVLIPGGVFKGFFTVKTPTIQNGSPAIDFINEFKKLGYDIEVVQLHEDQKHVAISAIKPGGLDNKITADELFFIDRAKHYEYTTIVSSIESGVDNSKSLIVRHKK